MNKNINKYSTYILGAIFVLTLMVPTNTLAQSETANYEAAFLAQVVDAGVLPTSPTYFLKEWGRGLRLFFTFDKEKKLEYQLDIVDEKAAELNKIEESGGGESGVDKGLENYKKSVEKLNLDIQKYEPKEGSDNKIESLKQEFEGRLAVHQQLLQDLAAKYESALEEIDSLQGELSSVLEENQKLEAKLRSASDTDTREEPEDDDSDSDASPQKKTCSSGYYLETDDDGRQKCFPLGKDEPGISYFRGGEVSQNDYDYNNWVFEWSSKNTSYCTLYASKGGEGELPLNKHYASSGSTTVNFGGTRSTTVYLNCYNSAGESTQASVAVKIDDPAPTPKISYFKADPVKSGSETYTFSWNSSDTKSCEIEDITGNGSNYVFSQKGFGPSDSSTETLTGLTTARFRIRCYAFDGSYDQDELTINGPPKITFFFGGEVSQNDYDYYNWVFEWTSINTSYCTIYADKGSGDELPLNKHYASSGTVKADFTGTNHTTVHLNCFNSSGESTEALVSVDL